MREVEDVMDELCAKPSMVQFCDRCGSKMLYIDAAFFLINGTRGWNMRLPLCPQCHEGGDDLRPVSLKAA